MGYKLLGYLVWQVTKLYVRRRMSGMKGKAALAGAGAAIAGGLALAGRQAVSDD